MNVEHLRYFIEIGRAGSISKAAGRLFISPQGLNKVVTSIEAEVGAKLIERTHGGSKLTDDGAAFLAFSAETIANYDDMVKRFARDRRKAMRKNPFTIGATPYTLHTVLQEPMYAEGLEGIRLEEMAPSSILETLRQGGGPKLFVTDFFDGSSLARQALGEFSFRPLFRTYLGIIRHRDFPLAEGGLESKSLLDVPLICYRDESIDWIIEKTFGDDPPRNMLLRTSNTEQLIKWVVSKRAVCLLDSFAYHRLSVTDADAAGPIVFSPVVDMPAVTTGFLFRADGPGEPEQAFMDAFAASFRQEYAAYCRRNPLPEP